MRLSPAGNPSLTEQPNSEAVFLHTLLATHCASSLPLHLTCPERCDLVSHSAVPFAFTYARHSQPRPSN